MVYFWELGNTRLRPLKEDDLQEYLAADPLLLFWRLTEAAIMQLSLKI